MGLTAATLAPAMLAVRLFGLLAVTSTQAEIVELDGGDPIEIDGRASELAWESCPWFGSFVQQAPSEGEPATEDTRFKLIHDKDAIYVFIEARDSQPESIEAQLTRRDADSPSDWLHVWLDPFDARRTSYRFSVNAAGVKQDARIVDGANNDDLDWNAVWSAAVDTSSTGWSVEMRIPLSELRYQEGHPRWGFEVARDLTRQHERSYFAPVPKGASRPMQHFAELDGVEKIPGKLDAAITPYVSGAYHRDVNSVRNDDFNVGGDGHLGLGSALVLDMTVNPDFAQVESDPSVLNLGTAETFFEEKRPFFVAGRDVLSYTMGFGDGDLGRYTLFYSRRVGVERVLSAAKLTGKSTDGWSLGALEAVVGGTRPTDDTDGEPYANEAVIRATQDYAGGDGRIGIIATHLYRDLRFDEADSTVQQAATFGVDLDHHFGDYVLQLRAYGSDLIGSKAAIKEVQTSAVHYFQRPDADYIEVDPDREAMLGWGFSTIAGKLDGKRWRGAAGAIILSPQFDPNQLGYLTYADRQQFFGWLQLRDDEANDYYQSWVLNFNFFESNTFGYEVNGLGGNINANYTSASWWNFFTGFYRDMGILAVTTLHGDGPAFKYPGGIGGWLGFESDARKPFAGLLEFDLWRGDGNHNHGWAIYSRATFKPSSWLEVQVIPNYNHDVNDLQYVDTVEDPLDSNILKPVIANLARDTINVALRVNWTINPDLSLQLYAAPYFTSGDYVNFRHVTSPRADRYADRFSPAVYTGDSRVTFDEVRANFVVRWEYTLGSTMYFVWSHGQTNEDPAGRSTPFDDFRPLFDAPSDDVFLVKVAHRLEW